jgi:hypothetical protein
MENNLMVCGGGDAMFLSLAPTGGNGVMVNGMTISIHEEERTQHGH